MSSPIRHAYDASLPFVAATAIPLSDRTIAPGEPVPWRDLGISEDTLFAWWRAAMVNCDPTAGDRAAIAPEQRLSRAERKALRRAAG